jgi:uncharacterized damage-inducible protein DinB
MMDEFVNEFLEQSIDRFNENTSKIMSCMNELNDAEIWKKPNDSSNSIGNQILHLSGNITQYIISSLGETEDTRERDKEFSATGGFTKSELIDRLSSTVEKAIYVIQKMDANNLLRKKHIQGFLYSGLANILHVVEHYSYHTGQIIFWTKLLKNKDLGFYAGMDLNKKNEL